MSDASILAVIGLGVLLATQTFAAGAAVYWARRRPRAETPEARARVSILIPIKGVDSEIAVNLAAFARQDYPDHEIVLVVADPGDPAMAEAERAAAAFPARVRVVTGPDLIQSPNPKTNTLARAYAATHAPLVMHCDVNLLLRPDSLSGAVGMLAPNVGLITTYYVGTRPRGLPAEVECAFLNGYARYLAAAAVLGHAPVLGKLMLYRRADLERAGGYARLAENPAHDTAMDRVIRRLGLRVRALPGFLSQPVGRRAWSEVWQRQVRWLLVRRINQPLAYVGEIVSGPIAACVCAGIAAALHGLSPLWTVAATGCLWYALEAVASAAARWHVAAVSPIAWVARDLMMPAMWLTALFSRRASWRGATVTIAGSRR